jgi:hypothetical protein
MIVPQEQERTMEPFITTIVAAVVAGATAKVKDVASEAVKDAYEGLRALVIRKLGKGGAVQSVEDDPESETAHATLAEAIAKKNLQADAELKDSAQQLEKALAEAKAAGTAGTGDIEIETVRGRINATVENLIATGRIKLGPVVAETGDAKVSGLTAGGARKN